MDSPGVEDSSPLLVEKVAQFIEMSQNENKLCRMIFLKFNVLFNLN